MMMMMMANQAEPLDSSCTNTKYMSWVWRKGLERAEGTQRLHNAGESIFSYASLSWLLASINQQPGSVRSAFTGRWSLALSFARLIF